MSAFIHDIATAVPPSSCRQSDIREVMKQTFGQDRKTRAVIHRLYQQSGIEKRHTVLQDFAPGDGKPLFFGPGTDQAPGTGHRNRIYEREARNLFVAVARQLMASNPEFPAERITHVITASCTGFYAPGAEYDIIKALALRPATQRFHLGFMGCYAALPALRMARAFCQAEPGAAVLVICAELCTLHFQHSADLDNILSASLFADGAAGALVCADKPSEKGLEIHQFASMLAPESEQAMAWTLGDNGFEMRLSVYVPDLIKRNIASVVEPLFDQLGLSRDDIDYWAIHPGGRSIIDKVQEALALDPEQVAPSRKVLAHYGNMSSATVLFVLKEILEHEVKARQLVLPMAFGPGLTIESALFSCYAGGSREEAA